MSADSSGGSRVMAQALDNPGLVGRMEPLEERDPLFNLSRSKMLNDLFLDRVLMLIQHTYLPSRYLEHLRRHSSRRNKPG